MRHIDREYTAHPFFGYRKMVCLLRAAGVDAAGYAQFFARAERAGSAPQWLSSHPTNEARAHFARNLDRYPVSPVLDAGEWQALRAICR